MKLYISRMNKGTAIVQLLMLGLGLRLCKTFWLDYSPIKPFLLIAMLGFASCHSNKDKTHYPNDFQVIITDTTRNQSAKWDLEDFNYRSRLAKLLGLSSLKNYADSLEIRLWHEYSYSNCLDLYTLKFIDTNCIVSYFRIYPKRERRDINNTNGHWLPYEERTIDSSFSKTKTISKRKFQSINIDSVWLLKSQSDLNIADSIGFTDCYSHIIEIADRRHLKFMRYHCPSAYYEKVKLQPILDFEYFYGLLASLGRHNNVYLEEKFQ